MPERLMAQRSLYHLISFFFHFKYLFYVSVWLPACLRVSVSSSPFGGQMRASDPAELGLWAIVGYLV